jgi:hypothetical protein
MMMTSRLIFARRRTRISLIATIITLAISRRRRFVTETSRRRLTRIEMIEFILVLLSIYDCSRWEVLQNIGTEIYR